MWKGIDRLNLRSTVPKAWHKLRVTNKDIVEGLDGCAVGVHDRQDNRKQKQHLKTTCKERRDP